MSKVSVAIAALPHAEARSARLRHRTCRRHGSCAAVDADMVVAPGALVLVPTGLTIALPDGFGTDKAAFGRALKTGSRF